jgi:hypothetical protein
MWQSLIKLVEKLTCCHRWESWHKTNIFEFPDSNRPFKIRETLICSKCGKIKKNKGGSDELQ